MIKTIGTLVVYAINIYLMILMVRVVLSWLRLPRRKWMDYIQKITDPVINFFRKQTPIRIGMFDLSIVVPFILLNILRLLIMDLMIEGRSMTSLYLLSTLLTIVNMLFGWFCFLVLALTVILFFITASGKGGSHPIIMTIRAFLGPVLAVFRRVIPIQSRYADLIYLAIMAIIIAVAWGIVGGQLANLIEWIHTQDSGSAQYLLESLDDTFDYP